MEGRLKEVEGGGNEIDKADWDIEILTIAAAVLQSFVTHISYWKLKLVKKTGQ